MHDLKGRGMDRVAAKIAQKIPVFSSTVTSTPARASKKPSIIPAGPRPQSGMWWKSAAWTF